jgi:predicted nucleic acid-binding protein
VIVADASVAIAGLVANGESRRCLEEEHIVVPHLTDAEVVHGFRSMLQRGVVSGEQAATALDRWARLGVSRFGVTALLPRIWSLRHNLTAYDATYVALAESLECELRTADARMANASGPECPIRLVSS